MNRPFSNVSQRGEKLCGQQIVVVEIITPGTRLVFERRYHRIRIPVRPASGFPGTGSAPGHGNIDYGLSLLTTD